MDVQVITQAIRTLSSDALVIAAAYKSGGETKKELTLSPTATELDQTLNGLIQDRYRAGEFKANPGELLTLHTKGQIGATRVIVVGLGSQEKVTSQTIRRASSIAVRHLQNTGAKQIVLGLAQEKVETQTGIQAQVEGALLGIYTFRIYQSNEQTSSITQIQVLSTEAQKAETEQSVRKGQALAEATNFARTLINEPPNVLTPTELANRASSMAKEVGIECEIFDREKIKALGMGGLLGVSQGSAEPPRFIILRYRGGAEGDKGLALVGKGITFDTGGISLKPADRMDEMKGDMGGAAAVIGAMQAIGQIKPAINVTAFISTCENRPSSTSYLPGDILRIMNGKTIEIVNTDAEGRLVLADALSYAVKEGHSTIIDLATLTGGIVVALGSLMTGLFSNDESLTQEIIAAGQLAGEKYWPMPLDDDYSEMIRSDIADIKQTGGRQASAVTAAKILENFVGTAQWAHLDIAGTSYVDSKKPYQEKGGVGVGVRTLAELAIKRANNK
ncbi:leucyl aminopeptidase [Tengunoibacter tsumagoiensis]|uniref:Probable cytosol aminopeptidase n=1 Tax=Tengunoibacter tsumagoiensis TaxID=2014871 RepID=A0A402A291_9CHLR|nr:leucyl aminopeptidase [Tengunoibacter tsumagoiensis]GCE13278.1 putative cytosol aminopeptidase [Tengunoibacter tsumagoiensis]